MVAHGVHSQRMSGRVHRVLVTGLKAGEVQVTGPEAHHLTNVLRVKPGAKVEAFDGSGNAAAGEVVKADRQSVTLRLEEPRPARSEAPLAITVAVALLKSDKLSDVVRQCTELGVAAFQLLVTQHADATSMSPARLQRLRRVAEEAARQSGRATVPAVNDRAPLATFDWQGLALVAHPEAGQALAAVWPPAGDQRPSQVTLFTGPEGGFSEAEVTDLVARGAVGVRFGPRILRAETAPVALAAALLLPEGR